MPTRTAQNIWRYILHLPYVARPYALFHYYPAPFATTLHTRTTTAAHRTATFCPAHAPATLHTRTTTLHTPLRAASCHITLHRLVARATPHSLAGGVPARHSACASLPTHTPHLTSTPPLFDCAFSHARVTTWCRGMARHMEHLCCSLPSLSNNATLLQFSRAHLCHAYLPWLPPAGRRTAGIHAHWERGYLPPQTGEGRTAVGYMRQRAHLQGMEEAVRCSIACARSASLAPTPYRWRAWRWRGREPPRQHPHTRGAHAPLGFLAPTPALVRCSSSAARQTYHYWLPRLPPHAGLP